MLFFTITAYLQSTGRYGHNIADVAERQANIAFMEIIVEIMLISVLVSSMLP